MERGYQHCHRGRFSRSGRCIDVFIDLNGEAGAHPAADTAGVTLFGIGEDGKKITLGCELVLGHHDAATGAEFSAVAAPLTNSFVDYYFTFSHVSPYYLRALPHFLMYFVLTSGLTNPKGHLPWTTLMISSPGRRCISARACGDRPAE
jgi:hypothetical protein